MMMSANVVRMVYTNLSRDLLVAGVKIHDIEKFNDFVWTRTAYRQAIR